MFFYLSQSVGSGKTQAVLEYIRDNFETPYLYVAPTKQLCEEVYERLLILMVDRNDDLQNDLVQRIVTDDLLAPVFPRAIDAMEHIRRHGKGVLIVTTVTFKYLLGQLTDKQKAKIQVFVDEGLQPIEHENFSSDRHDDYLRYFTQDENGFITPKKGSKGIIEKVAINPKKLGDLNLDHLSIGPFRRICSLIHSGNYDVYLKQAEHSIMAVGLLSPRQLKAFRSVVLIVANFEETLFPIFWKQRHQIDFEPFDIGKGLFDTHRVKGPDIRISYVLHQADKASKRNLLSNFETGEVKENDVRKQVIYAAARAVDEIYPDGAYCWATNNDFKNADGVFSGDQMPAQSAGIDKFKHFDTVVSLVCINPLPWVKTAILEIFDLNDDRLYELWRLSHTYQTVGRCSLRNRKSKRKIHMIVISRRCAEQLSNLFVGSKIDGQITKIPCMTKLRKNAKANFEGREIYSAADNSAYSKFKRRCLANGIAPKEKAVWYHENRIRNLAD